MKKIVILIMALLLVGCSGTPKSEQIVVYSFSGENDDIRISNGVITVSPTEYVFHGGNIYYKDGTLDNILNYSTEFYYLSGKEKNQIVTSSTANETDGVLEIKNGQDLLNADNNISGSKDKFMKMLENNLYFKLSITDANNEESEYLINLKVTKVEKK